MAKKRYSIGATNVDNGEERMEGEKRGERKYDE